MEEIRNPDAHMAAQDDFCVVLQIEKYDNF